MKTYAFQTYEGCMFAVSVIGEREAAALDQLLCARRGVWASSSARPGTTYGLLVPFLNDDFVAFLASITVARILEAAAAGCCMPGQVLDALTGIKRRADFWQRKARAHEAGSSKASGGCTSKGQENDVQPQPPPHGDIDQPTIAEPDQPPTGNTEKLGASPRKTTKVRAKQSAKRRTPKPTKGIAA